LATEEGAALAEECVLGWEPAVFMLVHGSGLEMPEMPEGLAYAVLTACEGKLPLGFREGKVRCARGYHAINAGCGLLSWGVLTGRCGPWRFTPAILALMLEGQEPKSQELFQRLKLDSAASWQAKCDQVGRARKPWKSAVPTKGINAPDAMMPNLLMSHLCEYAQCWDDPAIGDSGLRKLIRTSPPREIVDAVVAELESEYALRGAGVGRQRSVTQVMCTALLGGRSVRPAAGQSAGSAGPSTDASAGSTAAVPAEGKAKGKPRGRPKGKAKVKIAHGNIEIYKYRNMEILKYRSIEI